MMEVSSLETKKSNGASKITNENKSDVQLPVGYKPSADEEFMNPKQIEYFRQKLVRWRAELLDDANQTIANLSTENLHRPDQMDRAQIESNAALDLRTRDRERKLLQKIDSAMRRIEDGSYGTCQEGAGARGSRRCRAAPRGRSPSLATGRRRATAG